MIDSNSIVKYSVLTIWAIGIIGLLFFVDQSSFVRIAIFAALAFWGYWKLARMNSGFPIKELLICGVILRVIAVFSFPALSDDIFRFIWDGRLAAAGIHPFEQLPAYYLESGNQVQGLTQELFNQLNSKTYYTIYPPLSQGVFYLAAILFPKSMVGFSIVLKGILVLFDIGVIYLLIKILALLKLPKENVLWYTLNPLVIVEIAGNAHFEGAMIFFLLLAFYCFINKKLFASAMAIAASVASKILPLMMLPFVLIMVPWKQALKYYLFSAIGILLFTIPLLSPESIGHFSDSFNLYFQKFEFNASVYYIIRWIGFQVKGFNIIQSAGPVLGLVVFGLIWVLTIANRKSTVRDWPRLALWALTIYFVFATIVHPWYITSLVALCVLTQLRFPVLWSGLILLTYINYSYTPYFENLWVVTLEYVMVLGMLIFEIKTINFTKGLNLKT